MGRLFISIIGASLIAFFIDMIAAQTASPSTSGLECTVLVSPSRPGPITKDGPSVGPARDVQFVIKAGDIAVKTFTTDGEGRFQVALPPGHYLISRAGPEARIGRWRFEADVVAGA